MKGKLAFKIITVAFILGMIAFTVHFMMNTTSPSQKRRMEAEKNN